MRLIDADRLMERLQGVLAMVENERNQTYANAIRAMIREVKLSPIIESEPVRHGGWIHTTREDSDWGGTFHRYTCSACNWSTGNNPTGWGIFCPACGAKMDGGVENE